MTFPSTRTDVEFVVPRPGEGTVAVVKAQVGDALIQESEFLKALREGLTKWAKETEDGNLAWANSSHDFNVGDLANEYGDGSLTAILRDKEIIHLDVEVYGTHEPSEWNFDTVLIDNPDNVVDCKFCGKEVDADTAHMHQGSYVGECCWDERLRTTELA